MLRVVEEAPPTRRLSPLPSSSVCQAWRASAPPCATPLASSLTSSQGVGESCSFLSAPPYPQSEALRGALILDPAPGGAAPAPGQAVRRLLRGDLGEVGLLLGLWRETAPTARHQPSAACLHGLTAADVKLIEELLAGAGLGEDLLARRLFGDWPTRARGWRRPSLNVTTTFAARPLPTPSR